MLGKTEQVQFRTLEVGDEFLHGRECLMKLPDGVFFNGMTRNAVILNSRHRPRAQPVTILPDTWVLRMPPKVVQFRLRGVQA